MFQNCANLNEIKIGYTGNFDVTYFGRLTSMWGTTVDTRWMTGVQTTSGTFYYNGSDTTRGPGAIPNGWTVISTTTTKVKYTDASGHSDWTSDIVGELAEGDIPNVVDAEVVEIGSHVTSIGDFAFGDCGDLTSVTIPDSVTSIGEQAFYGCYSLTSITIPDSVTSIKTGAFEDCGELMSVTFTGKTMATVQGMSNYSWSLESGCVLHCTDGDITI